MSATRPEHLDIHGLAHRYGCRAARITRRPAALRPEWDLWRCHDCGAVALVRPDVETESVTESVTESLPTSPATHAQGDE